MMIVVLDTELARFKIHIPSYYQKPTKLNKPN